MGESSGNHDISLPSTQASTSVELDVSTDDGKDRSWVRKHYEKRSSEGEVFRLFCKQEGCNVSYSIKGSHLALKKHYEIAHNFMMDPKTTRFTLDDNREIDALMKWVIIAGSPYRTVDNIWFRRYCRILNPSAELLSRNQLSSAVISNTPKLQRKIADELKKADGISLTFDIWTARKSSRGFGVVTAHFIGREGTLQSIVLRFRYIPCPHDTERTLDTLKSVIEDFDIAGKVVSITTDSASTNISAIRKLRECFELGEDTKVGFRHVRCFAHILHNALKDGLQVMNPSLDSLRAIVRDIKKSTKKTEAFMRVQTSLLEEENEEIEFVSPLKLLSEVQTRWNSTYIMLKRAYQLRKPIADAIWDIRELNGYEEPDWIQISKLMSLLKPFEELTRRISSDSTPTLSLLRVFIPKVIAHLDKGYDDDEVDRVSCIIKTKLLDYMKYLQDDLLELATILDPRTKLSSHDAATRDSAIERLRSLVAQNTQTAPSQSLDDESFFADCFGEVNTSNEVDLYIALPRMKQTSDPLNFWMANKSEYPNLAPLARTVLAIQSTSVASERAFSLAGLIDNDRRCNLSKASFESLVQLRSWLLYACGSWN